MAFVLKNIIQKALLKLYQLIFKSKSIDLLIFTTKHIECIEFLSIDKHKEKCYIKFKTHVYIKCQ